MTPLRYYDICYYHIFDSKNVILTKIPIWRNLTLGIFSSLPSFFFSLCILLIDGERMEKSPSLFPPRTFLRRQTTWPWKWIKSGCIGHGRSCFMCQQFCISLGRTMVGYGGLSDVVAKTLYSTSASFHHRRKSRLETTSKHEKNHDFSSVVQVVHKWLRHPVASSFE